MTLAQLARLIVSAISSAATQTVQDIESFFTVTIAQIEYVASWFGYNGPGSPAEALQQSIDELLADVSDGFANVAAILNVVNAIKATQDANLPVTLSPIPPPGYGGATGDEAASAVWDFTLEPAGVKAGDWASDAAQIQSQLTFNNTLWPLPDNPLVGYSFSQGPGLGFNVNQAIFTFQPGPPLPDEDQLSYLTRAYPEASWFLANNDYYQTADATDPDAQFLYTYLIPTWQWGLYTASAAAVKKVAPVWPGLDNVTLGDPVALSNDCEVPGPLDGLLIHLTGVPSGRDGFTYGPFQSYIKIGALTFVSDNGDSEFIQALSLDSEVYSPRSMARAQSAVVRAANGVTGTATPWLTS